MKKQWNKVLVSSLLCVLSLTGLPLLTAGATTQNTSTASHHVLLVSVDGLHSQDLARYIRLHPNSALARLASTGVTYTNASTTRPSDSFPGLLSMVTGGTPRSTGVFYDDAYDRNLSAPGSNCATKGTKVVYDESIDKNLNAVDAGGGIDPAQLPLDSTKGCTPVYPHQFLRVNTIFEVVHQAGLPTAWSDKHPAYDILNGPSGKGVDDLYSPEIAANNTADSVSATEAYDDTKVQVILNEIDGKDHSGTKKAAVPALFGMNFQAVSVGQKLATGGYLDSEGTPSASLQDALDHTNASIGKMATELSKHGLLHDTTIIVTAKHGQSPIDPNKHQIVDKSIIPNLINSIQPGLLAQATQDDVSLLWLTDQSKVHDVVAKLSANEVQANISEIISGDELKALFKDPTKDSRTPDVIVIPNHGVIYAGKTATKIAEHGGFSNDDTHVALLISQPQMDQEIIYSPVETTQIAPSILQVLKLDPQKLQAVRSEQTQSLPGLENDK